MVFSLIWLLVAFVWFLGALGNTFLIVLGALACLPPRPKVPRTINTRRKRDDLWRELEASQGEMDPPTLEARDAAAARLDRASDRLERIAAARRVEGGAT
jgi:hypothetical protein